MANTTSNDMNLDPLSKEPGAHPIGTGLGAVMGGAAAGAAAGAFGGPVGALVGGVAGAIVGGLGGKAAAEAVNPTAEEGYWRDNYQSESYYEAGRSYDDYLPAYQLGMKSRSEYQTGSFEDHEPHLSSHWDNNRGASSLSWPQARHASRAAWNRVDSYGNVTGFNMGSTGMLASSTLGATATDSSMDSRNMTAAMESENILSPSSMDELDNDDVIDTLNGLLETCRDGEYGYRESSEHAKSAEIKTLFARHADSCRSAGQELITLIRQQGGDADEGGTVSGALHRGWVSVRGTLAGYSDQAMLDECERGEDAALARYRKASKQNLPTSVQAVVERQLQGTQRNHDQIKSIRDSVRRVNA